MAHLPVQKLRNQQLCSTAIATGPMRTRGGSPIKRANENRAPRAARRTLSGGSLPEVKLSKLIMWNLISLDGFFEGTEPWSLDWFQSLFDDELQQVALEQLHSAGALVFGRATYEGMAAYWSSASGEIADLMNRLPKVVFSRTLDRVEWQNASLVKSDVAPEIRRLKSLDKGQIYVFASADRICDADAGGIVRRVPDLHRPGCAGQRQAALRAQHWPPQVEATRSTTPRLGLRDSALHANVRPNAAMCRSNRRFSPLPFV
jgi:dihydrofolate reductase